MVLPVVPPGDQVYVEAPEAVSVAELPLQIFPLPVADMAGVIDTVTVVV
jgi:hypothetical protein